MNFLLFSSLILAVSAVCNYGDTEFDGYCYQFVNQQLTYNDARSFCSKQKESLVRIRGSIDGRWLTATAATIFHATYANLWIGLHRENGTFEWEDGHQVDYLNWASGYPFSEYDYTAVQLSDARWVSLLASSTRPFICYYQSGSGDKVEISSTPVPAPVVAVCDGADLLLGHRCYFFNPSLQTFDSAEKFCVSEGKTLAIFDTVSQANFVTSSAISKFSMTYGSFWIGLEKNADDGNFYWPDQSADSLRYWTPGYPFQHQTKVSQQVSNGRWRTSDENDKLPSVCSGYV